MKNNEHKEIIANISYLFEQFDKLPNTIQYDGMVYAEHMEYISWINHQVVSLRDAFSLLNTNSYKSVFSLIRIAFESFWVIHLSMNGLKYYLNYTPKEGHNIQKIYQKWAKDFENNKAERIKQGILKISPPKKSKIKVIYLGRKDKEGKVIPFYYFLFEDYNPEIAYVGLEDPYYESENFKKINDELIKKHKGLKWYFSFGQGIKDNLLLNELVTKNEFERIKVHYNFLSMWTHPSINSIRFTEKNIQGTGNFKDILKYDFYLTRLALLYIGNILCLYLKAFLMFSERQIAEKKIVSIKNEDKFKDAIKNYLDSTNYFWFIYNEPHYYYKWKYVIKLIGKKPIEEIKKMNIHKLKSDEIEYYKNPIDTLKDLSVSWSNRLIGKYESPIEKELLGIEGK